MSELEEKDQRGGPPDWLVAAILIEATALLIALVTPVTPSKTGSTWTPAELFFADPTYVEEVLVSFLFVNLLIGILGGVVWIGARRGRRE